MGGKPHSLLNVVFVQPDFSLALLSCWARSLFARFMWSDRGEQRSARTWESGELEPAPWRGVLGQKELKCLAVMRPGFRDLPTGLSSSAPLMPSLCSTRCLSAVPGQTFLLCFCSLLDKHVDWWVSFLGASQQETSRWGAAWGVEGHRDLGIWVMGPELGCFQELSYKGGVSEVLFCSLSCSKKQQRALGLPGSSVPACHDRIRVNMPRVSPQLQVTAPQTPSPPLFPSLQLEFPLA